MMSNEEDQMPAPPLDWVSRIVADNRALSGLPPQEFHNPAESQVEQRTGKVSAENPYVWKMMVEQPSASPEATKEHQWTSVRAGGSPCEEGSYEYVRYCKVCGMEDTCEDPLLPCPGDSLEQQGYELCGGCEKPISLGPNGWVHEDADQHGCERAFPVSDKGLSLHEQAVKDKAQMLASRHGHVELAGMYLDLQQRVLYLEKQRDSASCDCGANGEICEPKCSCKCHVQQRVLALEKKLRSFITIAPSLPIDFSLAEDIEESKDLALLMQSFRKLVDEAEALLAKK